MEFIACIKLLSVVWFINVSVIADDNNGHGSCFGEIEHKADNLQLGTVLDDTDIKRQLIGDGTPEEPQPTPCGGK